MYVFKYITLFHLRNFYGLKYIFQAYFHLKWYKFKPTMNALSNFILGSYSMYVYA